MASSNIKLKRFDLKSMRGKFLNVAIVGPRNSGKSVLLSRILKDVCAPHMYDVGVAMCGTIAAQKNLLRFFPRSLTTGDGYDEAMLDATVELAKSISNPTDGSRSKSTLMIQDDTLFDRKAIENPSQKQLAANGRHYKITQFILAQYVTMIPSWARANVDIVFATKDAVRSNRKRLYEMMFGSFNKYADFDQAFTQATNNYGTLVIDKTRAGTSVESSVFWYRATPLPSKPSLIPVLSASMYKCEVAHKKMARKREREDKNDGVMVVST